MALTPRVQFLSSPLEGETDFLPMGDEHLEARRSLGPHLTRDLYRWAEYHQGQFGKKISQHGLKISDMGIVHGEILQAGSDTREYQRFMESLEIRAA